jgi:hypothetical protein
MKYNKAYVYIKKDKFLDHIKYIIETLLEEFNLEYIDESPHVNKLDKTDLLITYGKNIIGNKNLNVINIKKEDYFWDNYLKINSIPENLKFIKLNDIIKEKINQFQNIAVFKYENDNWQNYIHKNNNVININYDFIIIVFILLTRYEEYVKNKYDNYGRFQAKHSLIYNIERCQRPIVDEYRTILIKLMGILTKVTKNKIQPYIEISHDIDSLYQDFRSSYPFKSFASLVLKHRKPITALKKEVNYLLLKYRLVKQEPAFTDLLNYSKKYNYLPKIFFITYGETRYEKRYKIWDPDVLNVINNLNQNKIPIGIHPSTITFDNEIKMRKEFGEFNNSLGYMPKISRQHKLFLKLPYTYVILDKLGIQVDYSLGYSELNGFRAGTCRPFKYFDFLEGRELNIKIHPLNIMENVYQNSQRLNVEESYAQSKVIIKQVKYFNGLLNVLWHNTSFGGQYDKKWNKLYENIIEYALDQNFKFNQ